MKKEIRSTLLTIYDVRSAWGFGSFFRGSTSARDADILVVIDQPDLPLEIIKSIRDDFQDISRKLSIAVDLTILTQTEFAERPLLEMDSLVPLFAQPPI